MRRRGGDEGTSGDSDGGGTDNNQQSTKISDGNGNCDDDSDDDEDGNEGDGGGGGGGSAASGSESHQDKIISILPLASKCRAPSLIFFFTAHNAVPRINSRISARPLAASYLLRGGESKEARIHPL